MMCKMLGSSPDHLAEAEAGVECRRDTAWHNVTVTWRVGALSRAPDHGDLSSGGSRGMLQEIASHLMFVQIMEVADYPV